MADETGASPRDPGRRRRAERARRRLFPAPAEPALRDPRRPSRRPAGAWRHGWESLRLFSPAEASSLPGWKLPPAGEGGYPGRDHVIDYLARYEARYGLPVERPMRVSVAAAGPRRRPGPGRPTGVERRAPAVVAATGTWSAPYVPDIPGRRGFRGLQVHSARYRDPQPFAGKQVLVVGGGNSGAQILAEVAPVAAEAIWVTLAPPTFLPDEVDGRVLFTEANRRFPRRRGGYRLFAGDIVAVPSVRAARAAGRLASVRPFRRFTPDGAGVEWADGTATPVDAVIWCTGFRPRDRPARAARHRRCGGPGRHRRHPRGGGAGPVAGGLRQLDRLRLGHPVRHHPQRADHGAGDRRLACPAARGAHRGSLAPAGGRGIGRGGTGREPPGEARPSCGPRGRRSRFRRAPVRPYASGRGPPPRPPAPGPGRRGRRRRPGSCAGRWRRRRSRRRISRCPSRAPAAGPARRSPCRLRAGR